MRKLTFFLLSLVLGVSMAVAQSKQITGTVIFAEDGEPIIGASVVVKGTTTGTVTDLDGNFELSVPASAKTMVFSYIGMTTVELPLKQKMNVVMEVSSEFLDEVIVVAYGTAKKSAFTGSAATIKTEKITARQTSNVTNALAGQVAGVQTTSNNGQPGSDASVRIRGIGSISASNKPLYVVDGVPYDGEISSINPQDIASMTVLKDAASNALYGARGANGVILITTLRGKAGEAVVNFDAKWGTNRRGVPTYDVMTDPNQYYETFYQGLYNSKFDGTNAAAANTHANNLIFNHNDGGLGYQMHTIPEGQSFIGMDGRINPNATLGYSDGEYYYQPDNWYDELFNTGNLRQEYNVNVSGATEKMNFFMSAGYLDDAGITPNSGFTRFTTRLKSDYQVSKWLKVGANMSFTHYDSQTPDDQTNARSSANMFHVTNNIAPIYPMYVREANGNIKIDERGYTMYDFGDPTSSNFTRPFMGMSNPASKLQLENRNYVGDVFSGKWFAHVTLMEGLKVQANIGLDVNNRRFKDLLNPFYGQYAATGGIITVGHRRTFSVNQQYLATYNKTINHVHNFDFLAGYENYDYSYQYLNGSKEKLYNPNVTEINNAIAKPQVSSYAESYSTQGLLFRGQYDYDGKYFVSASYRRDASSRFAEENRWGNFWSIGTGWLMNKESFLENQDWIDMLKFKASYGVQGNDDLLFMNSSRSNYYPYQDQYKLTNNNGDFATTLDYKGNKDITWENSHSFNTGFDFDLFKGKLTGGVEYFSRKTTDMLYFKPVSPSLGYSHMPMNIGSMVNRGVELDLNTEVIRNKNVTWSINLNLTHFKNKVLELDSSLNGELIEGSRIYREGESMYQLYIRDFAGVDSKTGESLWYKNILDKDKNIIGKETTSSYSDADRYAVGDVLPKVYGGFGTTVNFYGFDASVAFAYQLGGRILDYSYMYYMHAGASSDAGQNWHKDILNAWTPENTGSDIPRLNSNDQYTAYTSTRFLQSSNYLSLQNVSIGYTLPKSLTKKGEINNIRIYFVADNVAMLTTRKGLDPRQGYLSSDNGMYSPIRSLSAGVSLSF